MRILFLSYWGLDDPLTVSTVFPNLQLLQQRPDVESVLLVTVERGAGPRPVFAPAFAAGKLRHVSLCSAPGRNVLRTKILDFLRFPGQLTRLAAEHRSDFLIARGALTGALAYLVWQRSRLPFYVESFEPHAAYMREVGVWAWYDPRYLFQRYWEQKQKQLARGLLPVAAGYRQQLIAEGVAPERVFTVPCSVDLAAFAYNAAAGQEIRAQLGFGPEAVVGIYVGKFGGLYYDKEAFGVFQTAVAYFGSRFRLIILTPHAEAEVGARLRAAGIPPEVTFVARAPHTQVPAYLSAADFAFAPSKAAAWLRFCSLVKIGEYWASGLPVLLTEGVGDDSDIIKAEGGGAVFNLQHPASVSGAIQRIEAILHQPDHRQQIHQLAVRYRSLDHARKAYQALLR